MIHLCSLSPSNCYVFFISFIKVCLQLYILLLSVAIKCFSTHQPLSSAARSRQEDLENGAEEPVLTPFRVTLLSFVTSRATDVYHGGVHDSLMTLALVGTRGARIRALGSQPGGSTIHWRLSDMDAVNSSLHSLIIGLRIICCWFLRFSAFHTN